MASAIKKITLSSSRDIPFNKLVLSQSNVRRVKSGVSIDELAESIARRGLIQSLHVRPVLDADGKETGMFEVPAGGRRYRALELLAKQKRLAKTTPVPCVVGDSASGILIDEISLVENIDRAPLLDHPPTNCLLAGLSWRALQTSGQAFPRLLRGQRLRRRRHPKLVNGVRTSWGCIPATWRTGEREGNPSP